MVAFIERLLSRTDAFPIDHLAGILCECADSGLTELGGRAEEFASRMDETEGPFPMATADDIRQAFRDGAQEDFISGRAYYVYAINRQWEQFMTCQGPDEKKGEGLFELPSATPASSKKIGRNDPCPCGNGKKYKKCHGSR